MQKQKGALVYFDGGETYHGMTKASIEALKKEAKDRGQSKMYKGYRYYDGKKDTVIVFDMHNWDKAELAKRKANGFLGIKEYNLY